MPHEQVKYIQYNGFRLQAIPLRLIDVERNQLLEQFAHLQIRFQLFMDQLVPAAAVHIGSLAPVFQMPRPQFEEFPVHPDIDLHK